MTSATANDSAITTTWPEGFDATKPGISGFAVREVAAPADAVFAWVRRVDQHPPFYPGLRWVKSFGGAWPELDKGSKLTFTLGAIVVPPVKVIQCDPAERRLAWGGGGPGLTACHAWTVAPIDEHRSLIRSEEIWHGPAVKLIGPVTKGPLQKIQTQWVEAVVRAATAYPAGPPSA